MRVVTTKIIVPLYYKDGKEEILCFNPFWSAALSLKGNLSKTTSYTKLNGQSLSGT